MDSSAWKDAYDVCLMISRNGFDFPSPDDALDKLNEEVIELKYALTGNNEQRINDELADVLFVAYRIAFMCCEGSPDHLMRRALQKFKIRFSRMMEIAHSDPRYLKSKNHHSLKQYWAKAKLAEK